MMAQWETKPMIYNQAAEHLKDLIQPDGGLYCLGWYTSWSPGDKQAVLDAEYTADDLEAIATYMRGPSR